MILYRVIIFGCSALLTCTCTAQETVLAPLNIEGSESAEALKAGNSDLQKVAGLFESRIRPVLIEHCYECHSSATEAAGGLLLDSRTSVRAGGDSGPIIQIGEADKSLIVRAISYSDPALQMPPTGKLPDNVIEDFCRWINQGAIDPRIEQSEPLGHDTPPTDRTPGLDKISTDHWAYQPLSMERSDEQEFELPPGRAVDMFIDQQLLESGMETTEPASPEAFVRRLAFDLVGLPPNARHLEIARSANFDQRLDEIVDQLLCSPSFGEMMARHWMDVVRYADSITLRGFILPEAWRYRDYLINAFNEDRAFNTMIVEQIAGDLLDASNIEQRQQQLVATAFLAVGNTNLEEQDKHQLEMDYLDEQLDVIGSAFLGQTLGCARCHDHKFDPISTKDYYALAGILRSASGMKHDNVSKWIELPMPLDEPMESEFKELEKQKSLLKEKIDQLKQSLDSLNKRKPEKVSVASLPGVVVDNTEAKLVGRWLSSTHTLPLVGSDYYHDGNELAGEKSATFEPAKLDPGEYEVRLAYQAGSNRSSRVTVKVFSADGEKDIHIDQRKPAPEEGLWISLGKYRFENNGQAYVLVSNQDSNGHVILDAVQFLPLNLPVIDGLQQLSDPLSLDVESKRVSQIDELLRTLKELENELNRVSDQLDRRPKYLTILESGQGSDLPVHIRGSVHSLGEIVPRGFPTALTSQQLTQPRFEDDDYHFSATMETGDRCDDDGTPCTPSNINHAIAQDIPPNRLDLARWIADKENPLTARVYANRIWLWFMGNGLVDTPNNFGTTGELPTHPELLDWLARCLIQSNWSTKAVVREIVFSRAYRRALGSPNHPTCSSDPDNTSYARGSMRRIGVESLRDSMLEVSGEIDYEMGGTLIRSKSDNDFNYAHGSTRRSIYNPVFRNSLPELFEQFDFADPSTSIGKRPRSTHALQALSLSNNPWVTERSRQAAKRWQVKSEQMGLESAVRELYDICFGRLPSSDEVSVCIEALTESHEDGLGQLENWQTLIQTFFSSLDFRFLE